MMAIKNLKLLPSPPLGKTGWPWTEETPPILYEGNKDWPKISIITPSFNQGEFIEETIRSVLLQNYPNLEFIIIDGESTDNSVEIIKKYQEWITYWVSEKDSGQSEAINKGIHQSSGLICNWINSDDYYLPGALHKVAAAFLKEPSTEVVCGKEYLLYDDGRMEKTPGTTVLENVYESIQRAHIDQPPTFFKKNFFETLGGVANDLSYTMDAEFWVKYLLYSGQKAIQKIDDTLTVFRLHQCSKTSSQLSRFNEEQASWMYSLMKQLKVPPFILKEWLDKNGLSENDQRLTTERTWQFNNDIVSPRKLRTAFIRSYAWEKYINRDFSLAQRAIFCVLFDDLNNIELSKFKVKTFLKPLKDKLLLAKPNS